MHRGGSGTAARREPTRLAQCHAEIVEGPVVAAGSRWVDVAREMALRYTGEQGLAGLAASYDWPRYLVRLRPRDGKLTTWQGAAWHPRYTRPSA